jgi:hypothetical protein
MARKQAMTWVYPVRAGIEGTPADVGLDDWVNAEFITRDGLTISGWFIRPETAGEAAPTVILLHGLGGNRGAMLGEAALLVKNGYNTLLIDLRHHGESEGDLTTLGYKEVEDVYAAVDYLLRRDDVDPERIGLAGFSLGAVTALRAAARIPEIAVVVAISGFKTIDDNVISIVQALTGRPPFPFPAAVIGFINMETGVNVSEVRAIDDLADIAPRPVLFIHGEQDTVVPVSNSQDMFEAAGQPKDLFIIPDAGHGGLLDASPQEFEQRFVGFFVRYLGRSEAQQAG